jgi:acyl-CoA thioester hydrolase
VAENDISLPEHWPIQVHIPIAWGEMDSFAHVNNTIYLRWFETARIAYFDAIRIMDGMQQERVGPILATTSIQFRIPLTYPDTVTAMASVHHIGRTSFAMAYQVTSAAHDNAIAASGDGVIVMYNYDLGSKVPVNDTLRERISALQNGT